MKKIRLNEKAMRVAVYVDGDTLDSSSVMVCREFLDPKSRRWCVMERDFRKPGDNWDAWTNTADFATKREAVAMVKIIVEVAADQRAEDEAVYYRGLGL